VDRARCGLLRGKSYEFKVFLVVDTALGLPVPTVMATSSTHDSVAFEPLTV